MKSMDWVRERLGDVRHIIASDDSPHAEALAVVDEILVGIQKKPLPPRKTHLSVGPGIACGGAHDASSLLATSDPSKVTCAPCLKSKAR